MWDETNTKHISCDLRTHKQTLHNTWHQQHSRHGNVISANLVSICANLAHSHHLQPTPVSAWSLHKLSPPANEAYQRPSVKCLACGHYRDDSGRENPVYITWPAIGGIRREACDVTWSLLISWLNGINIFNSKTDLCNLSTPFKEGSAPLRLFNELSAPHRVYFSQLKTIRPLDHIFQTFNISEHILKLSSKMLQMP